MQSGLIDVVDKIILEITERGFPDHLGIETLKTAKGRVKIAIDDFGTGDANLLELSKMEADIIKLDKFFVDQVEPNKETPKIIKGLIAFAQAMDYETIAEGVESEFQAEILSKLGVHMAQGWYFSKPLKAEQFIKFHKSTLQV